MNLRLIPIVILAVIVTLLMNPTLGRASESAGMLRYRLVSVQDRPEMIGGEAFSFLVPSTWKTEGGIIWRLHPTLPAAVAMRAFDPAALTQVEVFPVQSFTWSDICGPGKLMPTGSLWMGNEVRPPIGGAAECLRNVVLPRIRGDMRARVVSVQDQPKLADALRQAAEAGQQFAGGRYTIEAARVRIEYTLNGQAVEEDIYGVFTTLVTSTHPIITIQLADRLHAFRAAKGELDARSSMMKTIIDSAKPNLKWFNKYVQLVKLITDAKMSEIRAVGEFSRQLARTSDQVSDMMTKVYEDRQASEDRINHNYSLYMRGVDEYYDPNAGKMVELPSGYNEGWVNARGEYVITENPNFNPNVELDGSWTKLERPAQR